MKEVDLSARRVSSDESMAEVLRARAELAKAKKELSALRKDRDELLMQYSDLVEAKTPDPVKPSKAYKKGGDHGTIRVICGDLHGSRMDKSAVEAFLADLGRWKPQEIVLLGDMVDCGGFAAQHHVLGYVAETEYSFQDDIAAGNWFLDQIQAIAPDAQIHYLEGNHEDRVERWIVDQVRSNTRDGEFLRTILSPDALLNLSQRGIAFYRRSEVHIPGFPPGWVKMGNIYFVHELGKSKNAAADSVSRTAGNVVFGHTHREDSATRVLPNVGLVKGWNPGCLCQRQKLYMHSNPSDWSHGYAVQIVDKSGEFLHLNIPIWEGRSLAGNLHGMLLK